uniref:Uncharacterized protein n=1 Tax=Oryza meridionalis TaxID=40149 RepID=A0A0E0EIP8_9ORYZ
MWHYKYMKNKLLFLHSNPSLPNIYLKVEVDEHSTRVKQRIGVHGGEGVGVTYLVSGYEPP